MRVVFFPFLNNLGHVVPSLVIAEQLRERGHDVIFRGEGLFERVVREAGFDLRPAYTFSDAHDRRHEARMGQWTPEVTEASIESELAALDEDAPDVAVADLRPTLAVSARRAGVSLASVLCADWTPWYEYPKLAEVDLWFGALAGRLVARATPARVRRALLRAYLRRAAANLRAAHRRFGVPVPGDGTLFDLWVGDLSLLSDLPELVPLGADAPPSALYVGPLLRGLAPSDPTARGRIDPDRELIYVTLGSSGVRPGEDTIRFLLSALAHRPEQLFITTGGQCPVPPDLPEDVIVTELDDGLELSRRAVLTLCTGGAGSVYQSLTAGTPLFCVPRNHNQYYVAERVVRAGAGWMRPDGNRLTPSELGSRVDAAIADDACRARAATLAEAIAKLAEEQRAANALERMA